jgi:hypothetical protein
VEAKRSEEINRRISALRVGDDLSRLPLSACVGLQVDARGQRGRVVGSDDATKGLLVEVCESVPPTRTLVQRAEALLAVEVAEDKSTEAVAAEPAQPRHAPNPLVRLERGGGEGRASTGRHG